MKKHDTAREIKIRNYLHELRVLVRKQPLYELLMVLSGFMWPNNFAYEDLRNRLKKNNEVLDKFKTFIPLLAKYAILNSNDHVKMNDREINKFYSDLERAINLIIEIKDLMPIELIGSSKFILSARKFTLANQQFPQREDPKNYMVRFILLYKTIPQELKLEIDISQAIEENFKMSIDRLYLILLKTLLSYKGEWVSKGKYLGLNSDPYYFKEEELNNFFNTLLIDYEKFRDISNDKKLSLTGYATQFYGFSAFDKYPILENNSKIIIPSPYHFLKRITQSIYFDLLEYFQKGNDLRDNSFSRYFGKIFENYVGKQLEYLKDGSLLVEEFEFDKDKKKFADWTIVYSDSLILIEVKKNLLPNSTKYLMNETNLMEVLNRGIVKGLKQCADKIKYTKNKIKGLEKFSMIKKFYPVVVIFDDSYLLNDTFIRSIIDKSLVELQIEFENDWQVITTRELEKIVTVCSEENRFIDLLNDKISNQEKLCADWERYFLADGYSITENQLLKETFTNELELINKMN